MLPASAWLQAASGCEGPARSAAQVDRGEGSGGSRFIPLDTT